MELFKNLFRKEQESQSADPAILREKFENFLDILECNNNILKTISDMEEKGSGDFLFDINYIHSTVNALNPYVDRMIENMIKLGGSEYKELRNKKNEIKKLIDIILSGDHEIIKDKYTRAFSELDKSAELSVGGKNAQLGEIRNKLDIPVPEGFAISSWAYKRFIDANKIQEKISHEIESVDIKEYEDLERISNSIRDAISKCPLPEDLVDEINASYAELKETNQKGLVSMRSSAIGEDTGLSFAGQYATFLSVKEAEVLGRYLDVIASKFIPKAIYYFLSHKLKESELAMGVGCVTMINAKASGVIYTRNPVDPEDDSILINSIYGLGKYLVDGTVTPDVFRVSRNEKKLIDASLSDKSLKLVMGENGCLIEDSVSREEQITESITENERKILTEYAIKIENHYGQPQDIEWAVDHDGKPYILQTRPLRIVKPSLSAEDKEFPELNPIIKDGSTVCPGAGAGKVCHVKSEQDLTNIPDGVVLVAPNPFPGLITALSKAKALVTKVGSVASHLATISREYKVPALVGIREIDKLKNGHMITVDATKKAIYDGEHKELIEARQPDFDYFEDTLVYQTLWNVLDKIAPLKLVNPDDERFTIDNCATYHDFARYCHQKSMYEMFTGAHSFITDKNISLQLKSEMPLPVDIIYIDRDLDELKNKKEVDEKNIDSVPMQAFWNGMLKEGWSTPAPPSDVKGFMSVVATHMNTGDTKEFSKKSFAVLSKEYMLLSLKMGYHFTTIEAMCTPEPSKNYIKMTFKEGGASVERRTRRINLITHILSIVGFRNLGKGDYLDTEITYDTEGEIKNKLFILGRLSLMTKQLDMTLANDAITNWYTKEFINKLGLKEL